MSHQLKTLLAASALALLPSVSALAQDVTFDLTNPTSITGSDQGTCTNGVVTVNYVLDYSTHGAYVQGGWAQSTYCINITSSQSIAVIEFEGQAFANKTTNMLCTPGELHMHPAEVSIWQGSATNIKIMGDQSTDQYVFTKMRVWFEGTPYGKQYVADPTITAANGKLKFASTTPGTTFTYNMQLTTDGKLHMCDGTVPLALPLVVNVHGAAEGFENSATTTQTIPFASIYGKQGDTDDNGKLDLVDLQNIIKNLLHQLVK